MFGEEAREGALRPRALSVLPRERSALSARYAAGAAGLER